MIKLLIIADDYTGSLDTGVQFAKRGIETYVTSYVKLDMHTIPDDTEVLVVDAQTRHADPQEAYQRVYHLVREARQVGIPYLYIKIDSTLRGNIGSYLSAALDARDNSCPAILAPALPSLGRTTIGGKQYVSGQLLGEADIAKDLFNPVRSSYIPEILLEQSNHLASCMRPEDLHAEVLQKRKGEILIVDAVSYEDLARIARPLIGVSDVIMAGSAGFANTLSEYMDFRRAERQQLLEAKRVMVLCGSLNSISIQQICRAENEGMPVITLSAEQKKNASYPDSEAGRAFLEAAASCLKNENRLALCVASDPTSVIMDSEEVDLHQLVAKNVGRIATDVMCRAQPDTVVIFGGDTLASFLTELGVTGISPIKEVFPGGVLSQICIAGKKTMLITKAGAFGEQDTLVSLLKQFQSI